jgi:hypothetical protein
MDGDLILTVAMFCIGVVGACFAPRLPASGKIAAALSGVPWLGVGLAMLFC